MQIRCRYEVGLQVGVSTVVVEGGVCPAAHSARTPAEQSSAVALVGDAEASAVRAAWEALLAGDGGVVLEPGLDRQGLIVGDAGD